MKPAWPVKPLGEVATVEAGNPAPQGADAFAPNGTPFVRMQDLGRYGHTTALVETVDRVSPTASKRLKLFPAGSILVPKSGASIRLNHRAILGVDAHVVSHLAVIQARPDLNNRFAYYWLCSRDLSTIAHEADFPSLKVSELARIPVPLPPLRQQERIVFMLDRADELRRRRDQADHRTADLIPALFYEMFGDPATNPRKWNRSMVGTLFSTDRVGARCGPFGSALKKHEYVEAGIPVWGIENVQPNLFVEAGSLFITPEKYGELANYTVQGGDILISRAGTVGRMCVARPGQSPSIIGTNLIRLALDQRTISPDYFTAMLTHFGARIGRLRANPDEGAYSFMNTTVLRSLEILVPPIPLQHQFAARVAEIRALEGRQAESRRRLNDLFQSMLHRAFEGEL